MKVEQFIELIDNPNKLAETHISSIEKILSDYPFFQSAHLLYAKALQNSKHINYHNALKRTAVIAGNRAVLYRLLNQSAPQPAQVAEEVKERPVVEVEVKQPVIETKQEVVKEPVAEEPAPVKEVEEKPALTTINYVYTLVNTKETVAEKEIEKPVEEVTDEVKPQTLDEIVLNPVVEAYIETEILKINEKEPEIKIEEPQSFTQWLKQLPAIKGQIPVKKAEKESAEKEPVTKVQASKQKTEKQELLDKLLVEELRISKPQADKNFFAATQKTRSSVLEDENLVTETLAKIYVLQGNHAKAIRAYEILSLKFPEKSAYFASLIKEIKNNIK